MMRILLVNNYEYIRGGSDRVYQLNAQMLLDRGVQLATIACGSKSFDDRKTSLLLEENAYGAGGGLSVLSDAFNFVYRSKDKERIERFVSDFRPDVIHLHIFYGQISNVILDIASKLGIPTVMTVHEYRMLCPVSTLFDRDGRICTECADRGNHRVLVKKCNKSSLKASAISFVEASIRDWGFSYARRIDRFLMVSNFCLDFHSRYVPEIKSKSEVLYNPVDHALMNHEWVDVSLKSGFIYAGRLSREKGLDSLCSAFAGMSDLKLKVVGDGPDAEYLIAKYRGQKNIDFLGKMDRPQLLQEMGKSRYSVIPSEWYENNPMSVIESMAVGTPVIGANIGGIPELVVHGETGYVHAPGSIEAIREVVRLAEELSVDTYQDMQLAGKRRVLGMGSQEAYALSLMAVYRALIGKV